MIASGTCGATVEDKLVWELDDAGVLTISGTGEMESWGASVHDVSPWTKTEYILKDDGLVKTYTGNYIIEIRIGDNVSTIGEYAFYGLSEVKSVTIPNSINSIGNFAFTHCTGLNEIELPEGLSSIGNGAFLGCTELSQITFPNSLKTIIGSAFEGCIGLSEITFPDSLETITGSAFEGCTGLRSITIPPIMSDQCVFESCTNLNSVTFQDGATIINSSWFKYCTSLSILTIPASITTIEVYAYTNFGQLTDIYYGGRSKTEWDAIKIVNPWDLSKIKIHCSPSYYVKFWDLSGEIIDTQLIGCEFSADSPDVPNVDGYRFYRWDKDFSCVTNDMDVFAEYIQDVSLKQYANAPLPTKSNYTSSDEQVVRIVGDYMVCAGVGTALVSPSLGKLYINVTVNPCEYYYEDVKDSQLYQNMNGYIKYSDSTFNPNGEANGSSANTMGIFTVSSGEIYRISLHMLTRFRMGTMSSLNSKGAVSNMWIDGNDINDTTVTNADKSHEIIIPDGMNYLIVGYWSGNAGEWRDTWDSLRVEKVTITPAPTGLLVIPPTKTYYFVGESLDTSGMSVQLQYDDSASEISGGYTMSELDSSTAGTKNIAVNYLDFDNTFDVEVHSEIASDSDAGDSATEIGHDFVLTTESPAEKAHVSKEVLFIGGDSLWKLQELN